MSRSYILVVACDSDVAANVKTLVQLYVHLKLLLQVFDVNLMHTLAIAKYTMIVNRGLLSQIDVLFDEDVDVSPISVWRVRSYILVDVYLR